MKSHIIAFILVFLLTGCSIMDDYESCPIVEINEADCINLTFRMVVPASGTRVYGEMDSEWPELEDRVDIDDFAFFIYAELKDDIRKPLIAKVTDKILSTTQDPYTNITGSLGVYKVKVSIRKDSIDNIVPTGEDFSLRIVAFANTDKKYEDLTPSDEALYSNLIEKASTWYDSLYKTIYKGTGGLNDNPKIPMYGNISFPVTRKDLNGSRPDNPILGGDMFMLRSLAKIKVIEGLTPSDEISGLPRIEAVTFQGLRNNAYLLPYNPDNYVNGTQVELPNECKSGESFELSLMEVNKVRIGYVPEQFIGSSDNPDYPKFHIKITYSLDDQGNPNEQKDFIVPMKGYKGISFNNFGEAILRNHIYTLEVDIATSQLNLNVAVNDWRTLTYEYEY